MKSGRGSLTAVLALALAAGLSACGKGKPAQGQPGGGRAGAGNRAFPVDVQPVRAERVQYTVEAVGSLEPLEEARVTARVAGVVEQVRFEEGMEVTPETVLAEIDRTRYELTARRARAMYERAKVEQDRADTFLKNRLALKQQDPGWVSEEEIATVTSQVNAAKASAAEARAAMELADHDVEYARVRSLMSGIINTKHIATGQYVQVGAPVASIVNHSRLKLRFKVSESESVKLHEVIRGDRLINFSVRPIQGKVFEAELGHISPQADPQTRMVECLATVRNPDARLKPGFFAVVRTVIRTRDRAVVVPDTAILPTERGVLAFVVEGTTARMRKVTPGLFVREGMVEIVEGLREGERLVVSGAAALREGAEVLVSGPVSR